jgi:hypothetical protein
MKDNFALEDERVFRPYLATHCSGVTEIQHIALPAHALHAVNVICKSFSNERYFSRETQRVLRPYFAPNWTGVTEISHMALPSHALRAVKVRSKSVCNEGPFT